jgi:hypothetical protein
MSEVLRAAQFGPSLASELLGKVGMHGDSSI